MPPDWTAALTVPHALAVAAGAACGALLRWVCSTALNALWPALPPGTLLVNLIGGAGIGTAMAVFARWPDETLRLLIVTGLLGGLTTFSSFSAESLGLLLRGDWAAALLHTLVHVLGALACTAAAFHLTRACLGA